LGVKAEMQQAKFRALKIQSSIGISKKNKTKQNEKESSHKNMLQTHKIPTILFKNCVIKPKRVWEIDLGKNSLHRAMKQGPE
jgi:hypothetical protein